MRYTLLMHWPPMSADELGEEGMAEGQRALSAYGAALERAGVLLSAEVLRPSVTTTTMAAVIARQDGPTSGLAAIDELAGDPATARFPPWWATRGHLLADAGRAAQAADALERAAALSTDPATTRHLLRRRELVLESLPE